MADNLTWLARNAHLWPEIVPGRAFAAAFTVEGSVKWLEYPPVDWDGCYQKHEWLTRRAELQNKPSWKDAPEWANWLAQWNDGAWFWCDDEIDNPPQEGDSGWYQDGRTLHLPAGEVLGDWRDTLERRPVDLSEPAVTARLTEATENVLAAAPALMDEKFSIDRNDWFERGELPPVGEFVDVEGEDLVYGDGELNCEVIAHVEDTAVIRMSYGLGCFQKHVLSPSRTERDKAIDGMKQYCPYPGSWDTVGRIYAEALYDAGYRKQNLPAK